MARPSRRENRGVRFLGVDLAWREGDQRRPANETGVAAIDDRGRVLEAGWTRGVADTIRWVDRVAGAGPALLFADAPLVVTNPGGPRPCDRQVGQRYGRWQVSANSVNTASPRLAGVALRRELEAMGWTYSDGGDHSPAARRTVCECYPYTTLVGAAELGYDEARPRYKRKPAGMPVARWRPLRADACDELVRRLASLSSADPPLLLDSHPATRLLRQEPAPRDDAAYKHREDLIDALICAWTAAFWSRHGTARCQVLGYASPPGTEPQATIIAPARPEQRTPSAAHRPSTRALSRGRQFHQHVQSAFLAGLLGATGASEHTITLTTTRNGRLDLLVLPHGTERMAVVVEIKSTSWDQLAEHRVRPNLRAHIRQLQNYLDVYVAGLGDRQDGADRPARWDSVVGVLLYPQRPANAARATLVEEAAEREALTVVWFNETNWRPRK
jgi:predicted RNase H-like nuclease